MPPKPRLLSLPRVIQEWPVAAQQQARRNAMVALTACAERRKDREDVAAFFAERAATASDAARAVPERPARHA